MADNTSDRGFAKMKKSDVSKIGKMGAEAQPTEAKRKGAENQPTEAKRRGGEHSHRND